MFLQVIRRSRRASLASGSVVPFHRLFPEALREKNWTKAPAGDRLRLNAEMLVELHPTV
jgi:hypothetical protein